MPKKKSAQKKPKARSPLTQPELLTRALAIVPQGLPNFSDAFELRIGDAVDQFVQSFYECSMAGVREGLRQTKYDAEYNDRAIEILREDALANQDLAKLDLAYRAYTDHHCATCARDSEAYYLLGIAVALRAVQQAKAIAIGDLSFVPFEKEGGDR